MSQMKSQVLGNSEQTDQHFYLQRLFFWSGFSNRWFALNNLICYCEYYIIFKNALNSKNLRLFVVQVLNSKLGITLRVSDQHNSTLEFLKLFMCHCFKSPDESLEQGRNASR